MNDGTATVVGDAPCVLVVGDADAADAAMDALAARFEGASILRERTLEGARERLAGREIHCLVCPFESAAAGDRPNETDATLEGLTAHTDERPIVAVTDRENADRALSAGATDVVDRDDSPAVLTARVRNAAERERNRLAATASDRRHRAILESAAAVVWVVDADGEIEYATPAVEPELGYTPTELERTAIARLVHPDDRAALRETLASVAAEQVGATERVAPRVGHADGTWRVSELTVTNRLEDPTVEGLVVTRTGSGSTVDSPASGEPRAGVDRLADAFFTLGPRDELRYANDAAMALFDGFDAGADTGSDAPPETDAPPEIDIDTESGTHSSDRAVPTGTVVWDLLPDAVGEALYDRVRAAETTGSVETVETTAPEIEGPLVVTVHPGDDGSSVHARERPPDAAASATRDRLDLLESVVDALDDGVAVLEGSTIRLANSTLHALADADALVGRDLEAVFDDDLAATVRERARSPVVRWMEPVSGALATDSAPPVDVFVAPLSTSDRTLCVVRDRRDSGRAALSTVRATVATIRRARTPSAVRDAAAGAVRECADADVAVWYQGDEDGRLRPAAVATADRAGGDRRAIEPPPIDPDGTPLADHLENRWPDDRLAHAASTDRRQSEESSDRRQSDESSDRRTNEGPAVYDRAELDDVLARAGLRAERVLAVPVAGRAVVLATSTEPMAFDGLDTDPIEAVSDAAAVALEGLERADALRTCERDRSRLETVAERAERAWDAAQSMLAADTREAVEQHLCDAVVSLGLETADEIDLADGVALAWVGRADDGREAVVPTAWAGRDGEFLESTTVPLGRDADAPTGAAAATCDPVVVDDLSAERDDRGTENRPWRRRLRERGFRSALSVALTADGIRYGTLTAYATRPSAFDDRTRRLSRHLATIAGAAIGGIETKRALLADRVTELEIVLRDDEPLSSVARRLDRRLDVRAVVPRSSGGSTAFCVIEGSDADAVCDAVASLSTVDSVSVVGSGAGDIVLEIGLCDPTVARPIADHGGVLRSLTPVDDRTRLVVDLGDPVDVRSFVRHLERTYAGVELVARRKRDRSLDSSRPFDDLGEHLSERQRRTLEAAYYGGFFEWPRERTGEEVAETLGISQPTFSRHLRIAQRKLFALLFDDAESD